MGWVLVWFFGEIEIAQETALAAEGVDAGEELLETAEGGEPFHGDQGFAVLVAGVSPTLGDGGGTLRGVGGHE